MSPVMEAEVRVQGSESSELGGCLHSASLLNLYIAVSVCVYKFASFWHKINTVL